MYNIHGLENSNATNNIPPGLTTEAVKLTLKFVEMQRTESSENIPGSNRKSQ